jgi:hypothetical protein
MALGRGEYPDYFMSCDYLLTNISTDKNVDNEFIPGYSKK